MYLHEKECTKLKEVFEKHTCSSYWHNEDTEKPAGWACDISDYCGTKNQNSNKFCRKHGFGKRKRMKISHGRPVKDVDADVETNSEKPGRRQGKITTTSPPELIFQTLNFNIC